VFLCLRLSFRNESEDRKELLKKLKEFGLVWVLILLASGGVYLDILAWKGGDMKYGFGLAFLTLIFIGIAYFSFVMGNGKPMDLEALPRKQEYFIAHKGYEEGGKPVFLVQDRTGEHYFICAKGGTILSSAKRFKIDGEGNLLPVQEQVEVAVPTEA
jgi:hypothetical protein